jgi:predicted nucleic acid-binding protein
MDDGSVLIDTGAFAALFDPADEHHKVCARQFQFLPLGKGYTCWPVVTEAAYLARRYPRQREQFLDGVATGDFPLLTLSEADISGIRAILNKFSDQEIDLADAALVHLAHREQITRVFTLDRRHFNLFRDHEGRPFKLLPEVLAPKSR